MYNQHTSFFQRLLLLCLLFQIGISSVTYAQSKVEKIDELLSRYTEYKQFNGSVLVAENGKVIYKKGHGLANMEWDIPNQADTKHRLGSITKQFTSMLILQLAEQDKLKLDVPISTYLPAYPKPAGEQITLHHLMTHSAGIPNYTSFPNFFAENSRDPYTPEEFMAFFADKALEFKPGERFSYSNSGYFLLGVIIEKVTGKSYEQVLQENIFTPLKMVNTGYDHHDVILEKRAAGYEKAGNSFVNADYLDMSIPYAAGSLYSTAEDLYLWDRALYGNQLLSKKYMDLFFTPHIKSGNGHYAYGWSVDKVSIDPEMDSMLIISHGGGINGFNTLITRAIKDQHLIVLLNNTGGTALQEITVGIGSILYDKPYEFPKKSVAYEVMDVILEKGIAAGMEKFNSIKDMEAYALKENEMNNVGYQLLQKGKKDEAIAIFQLNVDNFPKSSNVYDSLGEAYMEKGEKEKAIRNYKKSIELNPGNQNGINMLEKLGEDTKGLVEDVEVPIKTLDNYVGKYELAPGFILTVTRTGKQLNAQATGQEMFPVFPKSQHEFYLKVVPAQLTFNQDDTGKVVSVTLLQNGQELVGKKM